MKKPQLNKVFRTGSKFEYYKLHLAIVNLVAGDLFTKTEMSVIAAYMSLEVENKEYLFSQVSSKKVKALVGIKTANLSNVLGKLRKEDKSRNRGVIIVDGDFINFLYPRMENQEYMLKIQLDEKES